MRPFARFSKRRDRRRNSAGQEPPVIDLAFVGEDVAVRVRRDGSRRSLARLGRPPAAPRPPDRERGARPFLRAKLRRKRDAWTGGNLDRRLLERHDYGALAFQPGDRGASGRSYVGQAATRASGSRSVPFPWGDPWGNAANIPAVPVTADRSAGRAAIPDRKRDRAPRAGSRGRAAIRPNGPGRDRTSARGFEVRRSIH